MSGTTAIRLSPDGPEGVGLERMTLDPADFDAFPDEQRIHVYSEDQRLNLAVGIWTPTDMQDAFGPYPGDEFMVVLEGRVEMLEAAGNATPIETDQAFGVRNAVPLSWRQTGFLRRAFMLISPNDELQAAVDGPGVFVAPSDPGSMAMQGAEDMIGGGHQSKAVLFRNDTGTMEAGIWETTAF